MRVLHGIESLCQAPRGGVLLIGNFDGIHRGHACLLHMARELAARGRVPCESAQANLAAEAAAPSESIQNPKSKIQNPLALTLVTFEPHPLTVLRPARAPGRLTPLPLKQELLAAAGVDCLVVLPPTPQTLDMTAEQFWQRIRDDLQPRHLVEGSSFTFGKNRGGNIDKLRQWAARDGVQLHVAEAVSMPLLDLHIVPVSSSLVRWLLAHGRARDAAICLGRPYALVGPVVEGFKRGRTIGIPTANLQIVEQLIPADGVYAARCTVDGAVYAAALSIGTLPTFGEEARQVEAHLIGFDGDLYGRTLSVEVLDWVREQRKFGGVDALKAAMARDLAAARQWMNGDAAQPIVRVG